MPESATPITNTTRYPVYASKAAFLLDLRQLIDHGMQDRAKAIHMLYRLSNTDTSGFADPTVRHDA